MDCDGKSNPVAFKSTPHKRIAEIDVCRDISKDRCEPLAILMVID